MPDSANLDAEPKMQPSFSYLHHFSALFLFLAVGVADRLIGTVDERRELGSAVAQIDFRPVALDQSEFGPLRLAGAWEVTSTDRRLAGLSALAVDGNTLVSLSDSGVVVRMPKPTPAGGTVRSAIRELPDGPGNRRFKRHRDSEAIAADPAGRGWWVAFETHHELWLYDRGFTRALKRHKLPAEGWRANRGIEGMAAAGNALLLFPEPGGSILKWDGSAIAELPFDGLERRLSAAASLPNVNVLLVERRASSLGFDNRLALLVPSGQGFRRESAIRLPLGPLDNVEGLAIERLGSGDLRIWLVTDDNGQRPLRTLLVALDVKAGRKPD